MRGVFDLSALFRLKTYLEEEKVQLLHIYGFSGNMVGRTAARLAGVPVVITGQLSTDGWRSPFHSFLDRSSSRFVDAYVCNCKACGEALVGRDRIDPEKVRIAYDGIDPSEKPGRKARAVKGALGIPSDLPLIGLVANIRPMKTHLKLVEAAAAMKSRGMDFVILCIGKDFMGGVVQRRVRERGLDDHFLFPGYRRDVLDLVGALDIVVQPSDWEGFPISILEAMGMAKPVVAFRVSGIPEQVVDGRNGILVEPGDVKGLAGALIGLMDHPERAREMGLEGRSMVVRSFNIENTIRRYDEIYTELWSLKVLKGGRTRAGSPHRAHMHGGAIR
jgi:glycosyltransferase involved in cell wall biosynthesis